MIRVNDLVAVHFDRILYVNAVRDLVLTVIGCFRVDSQISNCRQPFHVSSPPLAKRITEVQI